MAQSTNRINNHITDQLFNRIVVTNDLSENQKEWFKKMLNDEIEQACGAATNEDLWAMGSYDNEEQRSMHLKNRNEQAEYANFLRLILVQL